MIRIAIQREHFVSLRHALVVLRLSIGRGQAVNTQVRRQITVARLIFALFSPDVPLTMQLGHCYLSLHVFLQAFLHHFDD